jgi:predicted acyltransferase
MATDNPNLPPRLLSIDVLRGLTIAVMILVNSQQGHAVFAQLHHAAWDGFTLADLVFPTFLFVIGISLVLSTEARLARGATKGTLVRHILRRSTVLFLFGMLVNTFPFINLPGIRYYGVLQRTAVCYLVVGLLSLLPGWKNKATIAIACVVGYWLLMRFVPVPGYGMPTHTIRINDPDGNLTAWLDRALFGPSHLYEKTHDPEGLLSTLPAIATTLIGVLAGLWLRTQHTIERKASALAASGIILAFTGLAWSPYVPLNKKIWTSSYVLYAGGLSLLLLATAVYLIDTRPSSKPNTIYTPFLVFGTNAITAYLISELIFGISALIRWPNNGPLRAYWAWLSTNIHAYGIPSLIFSITVVLITWLAVYPLYRKRIFLRV